MSGNVSEKKWLTPANVIGMASAVVGVIGVVVGVAAANPAGQRVLCGLNEFFCEDVEPTEVIASGEAIDRDAWCSEFVATLNAMPENDRPPGVGAIPSSTDCTFSLDSPDAASFTTSLSTLGAASNASLTANLSFKHGPVRKPVPFNIQTLCGFQAPGARSWTAIACKLEDLGALHDTFGFGDSPTPTNTVQASLTQGQLYFSQTRRLIIGDEAARPGLASGAYEVNLNVATPPESLKQASPSFQFTVE
jgi:hypothetical protein